MNQASSRGLRLLGQLWRRLPGSLRRRVLFATNHHFLVGVVGLIQDDEGRVLLLNHRFRTPYAWGLPGGFIQHGESFQDALVRELQEEIGLDVEPKKLVDTELNREGRYASIAILAEAVAPTPDLSQIESSEILEGGFFLPSQLPDATYPHHRRLIERLVSRGLPRDDPPR